MTREVQKRSRVESLCATECFGAAPGVAHRNSGVWLRRQGILLHEHGQFGARKPTESIPTGQIALKFARFAREVARHELGSPLWASATRNCGACCSWQLTPRSSQGGRASVRQCRSATLTGRDGHYPADAAKVCAARRAHLGPQDAAGFQAGQSSSNWPFLLPLLLRPVDGAAKWTLLMVQKLQLRLPMFI